MICNKASQIELSRPFSDKMVSLIAAAASPSAEVANLFLEVEVDLSSTLSLKTRQTAQGLDLRPAQISVREDLKAHCQAQLAVTDDAHAAASHSLHITLIFITATSKALAKICRQHKKHLKAGQPPTGGIEIPCPAAPHSKDLLWRSPRFLAGSQPLSSCRSMQPWVRLQCVWISHQRKRTGITECHKMLQQIFSA